MSADACEVVTTRTGARAMRDRETGELMHPIVGPLVEAERLYVGPSRLAERLSEASGSNPPLVLLDVGLGAASNAVAAFRVSAAMPEGSRALEIVSFDRSLAFLELALSPENAAAFGLVDEAGEAARAVLETRRHRSARTSWRLVLGELPGTLASEPAASADVVFWDPFSPRANPALWTVTAFTALRRLCRGGATVHTYSAATATRSAMLLAGFAVGVGEATGVDGPEGGKETTCAAVNVDDLARPLDRRFLDRIRRSSSPFSVDAPSDALAHLEAHPQFQGR